VDLLATDSALAVPVASLISTCNVPLVRVHFSSTSTHINFGSPYQDKDIKYVCDICDAVMNKDNWLYYCADCDFGAHLQCASPELVVYLGSRSINPNANSALEMINSVNEISDNFFEYQLASRMATRLGEEMMDSTRTYIYY